MKKNIKPKNIQAPKNNQKISTYFKRCPLPLEIKNKVEPIEEINLIDTDDDIIEDSPVKVESPIKKESDVPDGLTNDIADSPPHSTPFCSSHKKRKLSIEKAGKYPDEIPDMIVPYPLRKKTCITKENVTVVKLANLSKEEFDSFQQDLELENESKLLKSTEKKGVKDKESVQKPTPEKRIMPPRLAKQCTPEKKTSVGLSLKKTSMKSPKKTPSKTPRKSPAKTPRKSPLKLFAKSPNINEFKVDVITNFIKITPRKLQAKCSNAKTPPKNSEKKQVSIMNYASPSTSKSSSKAQDENEKTPVQKLPPKPTPASSRVKVKLDFTLSETLVTIKQLNINQDDINTKNVNICIAKTNGVESNKDNVKEGAISNMEDLKDMFDDSWDKDFEFTLPQFSLDLTSSKHCKVLEINVFKSKVVLKVQSTNSEDKAMCTLCDFWMNVKLEVGDIVHISAVKNESTSEWLISNSGGLLVYEPDMLISSTSVVGALFCKRKSILKVRYAGFDGSNKAMFLGTMVHSLLQTCLKDNVRTRGRIDAIANKMLNSQEFIRELYECSMEKSEIENDFREYIPRILTFMHQYVNSNDGSHAGSVKKGDWRGKIDSIQDIEENIWCHELGIKGKIDVSIKVGDSMMPLELKTGKASMSLEHRGQVILYIMMMQKLGYKVDSGLLLYLREGTLKDIRMTDQEKRDIIILRNELTYYLTRMPQIPDVNTDLDNTPSMSASYNLKDDLSLISATLPPPINHHFACSRCEYNMICCAYLQYEKTNLSAFSNLKKIQEHVLSHLESNHIKYFQHFSSLLSIESTQNNGKQLKDIYTKSAEVREKNGNCITFVKVTDVQEDCNNGLYSTTFSIAKKEACSNFFLSGIGESHYVVISMEKRPAVSAGLVSHIDNKNITIELDRNLLKKYPNGIYHLDTYESVSLQTFNFTNLSLLMDPTDRACHLRKLIIDKEKPTFKKTLPAEVGRKSVPILKRMNKMQQKAVIKALAANDYLLIKGMPGTGKTATIVALVQFLMELNQSVIITSHTHSAVDNVCIRLLDCGINVLRLGAEKRIHPRLKERSEAFLTKDCKTPEEYAEVYNGSSILAVTCIGSRHPVFSKRILDVCIVDESTQVIQCSIIRVLNAAKKFILIGDPDQLPPIVKNRDASARGLSESLFERLQCPESVVTLNFNYRMNKSITQIANDLTYHGQLLIANDNVANANLRLPKLESLMALYKDRQWILQALDENLSNAVCVLDTGPVWNRNYSVDWIRESFFRSDDDNNLTCSNPSETTIIVSLVHALVKGGISENSIGVIAPYRKQVAQIKSRIGSLQVDVSTVDQFQGQDKEVILYSCTKSRDISVPRRVSKFEILEDQRRLTVAITRAKHKFIILADVSTVREYRPFSKLFNCIPSDNYLKLIDGNLGFNWEAELSAVN